jgi:hypothetical protein
MQFNLSSPSGGSDICLAVAASGGALTGGKSTFDILPGDKADLDVEFWILDDVSPENTSTAWGAGEMHIRFTDIVKSGYN